MSKWWVAIIGALKGVYLVCALWVGALIAFAAIELLKATYAQVQALTQSTDGKVIFALILGILVGALWALTLDNQSGQADPPKEE